MNRKIVEFIIQEHILKLFPGVTVEEKAGDSHQNKLLVYSYGQSQLRTKSIEGKSFYLTRLQPFSKDEFKVIYDILSIANEYSNLPVGTQKYLDSISISRAVARSIVLGAGDSYLEAYISRIIDTLEKWATQTYEGNRISVSLGLDPEKMRKRNDFEDFILNDFSKVLSNGYDTLMEFGRHGAFIDYIGLQPSDKCQKSPFRYSAFASYTNKNNKYAFVLNRNGEILVFRAGELVFAKRRGEWRLFTHDSVIKQLAFGSRKLDEELRYAIYESALDASFARCGACIGVIQKTEMLKIYNAKIINDKDIIKNKLEVKSIIFDSKFSNMKYQNIDQRLRQEILGIDGATIIDWNGVILATGAILSLPAGSEGGARLAAAKCLREYGFSMKISADGEINVFGKNKEFTFA